MSGIGLNARSAICGGVISLSLGLATQVQGVAFRLPNQSPEGIARGNAFAATADNPSAIYYNPAGITQLAGQSVDVGIYLVSVGDTFDGPSGKGKTKSYFQTVPQLYYVNSFRDLPISVGLGVYAPYGLALDWGDSPFPNAAQKGKLLYATINPVVAWQVTPTLSLAIGPTINYSEAQLWQGLPYAPGAQFHFRGNDTDFGFNAGMQWKPIEQLAFGVNYHYLTAMNYSGHANASGLPTSTSATGSLNFPQYVVGGISYRPTTNWNFEVDIDWTDWDSVNQIGFQNTPIGNFNFVQNYKSSLMYEFGVTRQLSHGYSVMAGYFYSENSIPDATFNPIIPDSNLHLFSAGVAHRGQRWDWAFSYTCAVNPGREVQGSIYGSAVDGTYRTINHALNGSITWKF